MSDTPPEPSPQPETPPDSPLGRSLIEAYKDYMIAGSNCYIEYVGEPVVIDGIACTRELRADLPKTGTQPERPINEKRKREET